jgi:putative ABC transport system permease protein
MRSLVAVMLRLFPARFRRRYGADMLATFEDRWRERRSLRLAAQTVFDLAFSAAIERVSELHLPSEARKGDRFMTILWQDLRFAIRMLARSPGFTLVALATLALGIGINTAMFSVAHAVLWGTLPYPRPERLVTVSEVEIKEPDSVWGAAYPSFRNWQARSASFESFAAILFDERILREGPEPVRLTGKAVTYEFFHVLAVQPMAGRVFTVSEDKLGSPPVVVLSHRLWSQRFNSDPALLGRSITLGQSPFTVLGIMPPGFDYPPQTEYWVPLQQVIPSRFLERSDVWVMNTIGRLKDGRTAKDAENEIEGFAKQIRREHPEANRDLVVRTASVRDQLSRDLRPALLVLLGAVGLVLLIACGNLAGLMMARATGRAREMAIRSALGAGRRRLIRQLLTESALLSITGGLLGIGLSVWATRALQLLSMDPRLAALPLNGSVLLFALAATIATSVLFGVAPAIQSTRTETGEALKTGGARAGANPHRAATRQILVVGQVALCLVLLVGAGLLFRSFVRVLNVDPGFRVDRLLTMRISLPRGYNDVPAAFRFYSQLAERMKSVPGVSDASAISSLPISGGQGNGDIAIEGRPSVPGELGAAQFHRALPNYFRVMGIPLVRGREFDERDDSSRPHVTIINESMARRFWPNEDPIGRRIRIGPPGGEWVTIVGVVKDVRQVGLDSDIRFATYDPLAQQPWVTMDLAIRAAGDPASIIAGTRAELRRMEPALLIDRVQTMEQRISGSLAPRRLNLVLFGLFAVLALVLASVGLYGVVAYAVARRTQEFGIRMALGAQQRDVLRLVLGQGLKLALLGVAIGIAAALGLARLLVSLLFGVEPTDPMTIAGVSFLLTAVALIACWLPAHRATTVSPTEALRAE